MTRRLASGAVRVYVAAPLALQDGHASVLREFMRSSSAASARRARVLLLAADGMPNTEIASVVGVSRQTVVTLRSGYARRGLDVLADMPRSGRRPQWMKLRWW